MTIASHELALYEINTGKRYDRRCSAARMHWRLGPAEFTAIAKEAAREYIIEFCDPDSRETVFTTEDVLACAAELAEYYARHVAEM
jgi:hypothetical protein